MIFSFRHNVIIYFDSQFFVIKYSESEDAHIWANVPLGKSFDMNIPKKYYSKDQALNKAKVWMYELILDAKLKKTYENN